MSADASHSPAPAVQSLDIEQLRRENLALKAELKKLHEAEQRAKTRRLKVLKEGGRLFLPMFDRKRVVRNFVDLVETASGYAGPQESWPARDELLEKAKAFALSCMRFAIRRRMLMVMFSLVAFAVPAMQLYAMIQQNRIIENQNKYFNIQVYDTVARSITGGDLTAKQITTALLAREDFGLINGMIQQVFSSDAGGAFTAQDAAAVRPLVLRESAARGHLIAAMTASLERNATPAEAARLWDELKPTLAWVVYDAAYRVPLLLRTAADTTELEPAVVQECLRYVFNVGALLRKTWAIAAHTHNEAAYFATVSPFVTRMGQSRGTSGDAFGTVLTSTAQEWLIDLVAPPVLGAADSAATQNPAEINSQLARGFELLRANVQAPPGFQWDNVKRLFEVP